MKALVPRFDRRVSRTALLSVALLLAAACGGESDPGGNTGSATSADATDMDVVSPDTTTGTDSTDATDGTDGMADVLGDTSSDAGTDGSGDAGGDDAGDGEMDAGPDVDEDTGPPIEYCAAGYPCDDNDPCTVDDICGDDFLCAGTPYTCDDGRACTDDLCDGTGNCEFVVKSGGCLINNLCYGPGDAHLQNPCVVCDPATSLTEWSLASNGTACGDDDKCLTGGSCEDGQCNADLIGCDDGNACTDDYCDPTQGCISVANFDPCEDGDACTLGDSCAFTTCKPGPDTLYCDDSEPCTNDVCGPDGCLYLPKAGTCEDGDACTVGDFCEKGDCKAGAALNCDDGNICTTSECDPYIACVFAPVESACCKGGISLCDDGDACTQDACDEDQGTCVYTASNAPCDDGDSCTGPDECVDLSCQGPVLSCNDDNECTVDSCDDSLGGCQHQGVPGDCDDGNACTSADKCIGGTCIGSPVNCNDANPCTKDSCDPLEGCKNTLLDGPCDDGNACTQDTVCTATGCKGTQTVCSDGNPCTNDSCHPTAGCQFQPVGGPCSDQLDCSTGDHCESGNCVADTSECGCIPEYGDIVSKVTSFGIGNGGQPGEALDIDGDPNTCAPSSNCSGGFDNQLAAFASLANEGLGDAVAGGDLVLLFDHLNFKSSGLPYDLIFWPADTLSGSTCDIQSETCNYEIQDAGFDPETCQPFIFFDNARIIGGNKLTAGGAGYKFPFDIPLEGAAITMTLENAVINADVTIAGGKVVAMSGVLGGAVAKETFLEAIDAIDESELPDGVSKPQIKALIDILIQNDVDSDGDGDDDAASIGLRFEAIQGNITKVDLP